MPDLAIAMKYNPNLKVMLNAGYFDLATPFYEGIYEMQHLPIPAKSAGQHRISFLQIRAHGLCARGFAEGAARQRGSVHPQDREFQDEVMGAGHPRVPETSPVGRVRSGADAALGG